MLCTRSAFGLLAWLCAVFSTAGGPIENPHLTSDEDVGGLWLSTSWGASVASFREQGAAAAPSDTQSTVGPLEGNPYLRICSPADCGGLGTCNVFTGRCMCQLGTKGDSCNEQDYYPCNNPDGAWTESTCFGECKHARCFCGHGTKNPARPMIGVYYKDAAKMWRNAISSKDTGMLKRWGIDSNLKPRLEWLEKGDDSITLDQAMQWCNVHPSSRTVARVFNCTWPELHDGSLCYLQPQSVCLNQCSGLGECKRGMCSCYPGWTGIDCSLRIPSVPSSLPQSNILPFKGNLRRPRIFIYELPEVFNSRVLQFRYHGTCTTREFKPGTRGPAKFTNWDYNFDFMILEWLLHSVYRTTDPDEADYFFVPFLSSCYIYFGDSHPRHRLAHGARVTAAAQAAKLIHQHIDSAYPFWRRKGGKDHIWVWPWDEGACAAPAVIRPSIMISHWGARYTEPRTAKWEDNWLRPNVTWDASNFGPFGMAFQDLPATYDTASGSFNDRGMTWAGHREERGEAHCHDPGKDIVVPPPTSEWRTSEGSLYMRLLSKRLRDETFNSAILFYFAGDLGAKAAKASGSTGGRAEPNYSWGLRQRLAQLYANAEWQRKGIHVYHGDRPAYLDEMSRSKFCGVLPGDGWTSTYVVAITHGCIPVLIMDDVDLAWSSIMDYSAISVRIAEADLPRLYYILKAMPAHYVSALQDQVDKVWPRFVYFKYHVAMVERFVSMGLKEEGLKEDTVNLATEPMRDTEIIADDAMDTLLQQLYYRLPDVRRMMDINGKN